MKHSGCLLRPALVGLLFLSSAGGVAAEGEAPRELVALRAKYEAAKVDALKPVARAYGRQLQAKMKEATMAGKLDEALAFRAEMEAVAVEVKALEGTGSAKDAGPVGTRRKAIDLLGLIDLEKHGKPASKWSMEDGKLKCRSGSFVPKVILPYEPPEEFDFTVRFIQPKVTNGVSLLIPNGAGANFKVNAAGRNGTKAGLSAKGLDDEYAKTKDGWFDPKLEYTLTVEIRKGSLVGKVNGESIFEFKGERTSLAVSSSYFRNPRPNQLAICGDDNGVITKLEITEISGAGKLLSEE